MEALQMPTLKILMSKHIGLDSLRSSAHLKIEIQGSHLKEDNASGQYYEALPGYRWKEKSTCDLHANHTLFFAVSRIP